MTTWVEIIRGKRRGERGYYNNSGAKSRLKGVFVFIMDRNYPADAIRKRIADLRVMEPAEARIHSETMREIAQLWQTGRRR
jgi:hypothetical protein